MQYVITDHVNWDLVTILQKVYDLINTIMILLIPSGTRFTNIVQL